jgi:mono/diheme cytochrome c family protein
VSLIVVGLASILLAPMRAPAEDVADYYRQNCLNCHTIGGGRLTGPDLKDLSQRQKREWLVNFLMDPRGVIASSDPYAQKIFEEFRNVPMPNMPGMTRELAERLLDLIEAESKLEKSQFVGRQTADRSFTDDDRSQGYKLFVGQWRLFNGGTACVGCHSAPEPPRSGSSGVRDNLGAPVASRRWMEWPALDGGHLGAGLSNAYEKLGGSKPLRDRLAADPTETQHPVLKNHHLNRTRSTLWPPTSMPLRAASRRRRR